MAFSLYDATIPLFTQILGSMRALTQKAELFCKDKGMDEKTMLDSHFGEDMLPLSWQIKWTSTHSIKAIEGVRNGTFSPDRSPPAERFAALRDEIDATCIALNAVKPAEMDALIGKDMVFSMPERGVEMHFTADNFLLTFSVPNFMFHATTAYDLLRHAGVDIGKRDFLGAMRLKQPA